METTEWLKKLISFNTVSRHSNLELIKTIQEWFSQHDIHTQIIYDATQQKANLFATLASSTGENNAGLMLSGHTDVVPVEGQEWNTDPFVAVETTDRIYGRGACDMKGFVAVVLALLPQFKKMKLKQALHFAFSYDEEVGCHGAKTLITELQKCNICPRTCVVGEPTEMFPVIAHKGIHVVRCRIKGVAAHSSLTTQGCNAIEYAAQLINYVQTLAKEIQKAGPFDQHYDVPFTTLSTNLVQGGSATNIIPEHCEFLFDLRNLPMVNPEVIIQKIKHFAQHELLPKMPKQATIEIESTAGVPGMEISPDASLVQLAQQLTQEKTLRKVAYATEAGLFQQAGIETIICGPGSIEQAHRANEFVTLDQLKKCEDFLLALVQAN